MEIYYRPKELIQILHYTDNAGQFAFATEYHPRYEDELKELNIRELAKNIFSLTQLFLDRDRFLSKNYLKKLNPKYEICTEKTDEKEIKYILFSANVLNYFGLPGEDPKKEVQTLFDFFCKMRQVYSDFYETFTQCDRGLHMQIFTCHSALYECLDFKLKDESSEEKQWLDEKAKMLLEDMKQSPVLTAWLKHTRRLLGIMGPYSWQTFSPESFFEQDENPQEKRWQENYLKKKKPKV